MSVKRTDIPPSGGRSRGVHIFAIVTAFLTLILMFVGALVTSHDAGLSVPDWPNSYGQFMFTFPFDLWRRGNVVYEHGHRLFASLVGFLILVQAFMLQRKEVRRWVKRLGWIALAAVVTQGILGGLTVLFFLPTWLSTAHASLGQTTLCLTMAIALVTSPRWDDTILKKEETSRSLVKLTTYTVAVIFIQLVIGAWMRHEGAGLAIKTFPLANGSLIPSFTSGGVVINFAHRTWALVVATMIFITGIKALRTHEKAFRKSAITGMILVLIQIALGGITILSGKEPNWTSLHVFNGAAVLVTELILAIRVHHRFRPAGETFRSSVKHAVPSSAQ